MELAMHRVITFVLGSFLFMTLALMGATTSLATSPDGLAVESLLPQGRVDRITQIVVSFNKDMRRLGDMSQAAGNAPLKLDPQPAGSFRWLDTRTLAFILDKPLIGSSRLFLEVPAGIQALDGSKLAKARSTMVATQPIEALRVYPKPGSPLGPKPEIRLTLNQPVDLTSLARNSFLEIDGKRIRLKAVEQALPAWQRERQGRIYILTPQTALPGESKAVLVIGPGVQPNQGNQPLNVSLKYAFKTFGQLKLVRWQMSTAVGGGYDPGSSLMLQFNNPVNPKEALKHLRISPPIKLDPENYGTHPSAWLHIGAYFKPRTRYRVAVTPGLKDDWGTVLKKHLELNFLTGDLQPFFSLAGGKGVLEATGKPLYPLRLRNVPKLKVGIQPIKPDQAVLAMVAENVRPWNKKPKPPQDGIDGAVAKQLDLDIPPNKNVYQPLDLAELMGKSPQGGLVILDVRASWPNHKGKMRQHIRRAFVQYTDLGLSLKLGQAGGIAWVTKLSTGRALAGVSLELRDRTNKVLWSGVSDARGLAKLPALSELAPAKNKKRPWLDPVVYLLAKQGKDFACLPSGWSENLLYSYAPKVEWRRPGQEKPLAAHAVTQLPLYQPGQTVRFAVFIRKQTPQGLGLPGEDQVTIEVQDPYGRALSTMQGKPNAYGSLAGEFKLTPGSRLGEYGVWLKRKGGGDLRAGSFRVASFRPPDFKVSLKAPSSQIGKDPSGAAQVKAQYLFGAPVALGKAKLQVDQRATWFAPKLLDDYAVGDMPLEEPRLRRHLASLDTGLDTNGRGRFSLPPAQPLPGQPVKVDLEATASDAAGLTVTKRASYVAHPASIYLGLKAEPLATAGKPAEIVVAAATADNQPAGSLTIDITAYRQIWESVRERGPGGFWRYLTKARRTKVWSQSVKLGDAPYSINYQPPQSGTYVIVAQAKDAAGRETRSATYMYATGKGQAAWERFEDHRLDLLVQPNELKPGQTARLLIKNPFAKATALITMERQGVRRVLVREVDSPAPVIELPVSAADAPNVFVGVLLVRGRAAQPVGSGLDLGKPQVKIGYANLKVKNPEKGLEVEVSVNRPVLKPGDTVRAEVRVSDSAGTPKQTQVTLLAVDERVLTAAGGQNSYDPRKTFGLERPLALINADARTQVVGRRFEGKKGEQAAGGGGMGLSLRQKFHPAVFWLAQAETNEQGILKAQFKLPDSLTAYRIVAIAADKSGDFGMGKTMVKARRPLQMLSALPRFTVQGDRFSARFTVQNLSETKGVITVQAEAKGLKMVGPAKQTITLLPGESRAVGFSAEAARIGQASITVKAAMGMHSDAARFKMEILPQTALTTAAAAGALNPSKGKGSAEVPLLLPAGAQKGRGGLNVVVSPSAAAGLRPALKGLLDYPWDCLEQRLSKAAARAFRLNKGGGLGFMPEPDDRKAVASTLQQVADFQTSSGGLAFWPGMRRADVFLTAYALLAARQMQPKGPGLASDVRKQAASFLKDRLSRSKPPRKTNLPRRLAEALALAALAREKEKGCLPLLQNALTRLDGLTPFGLACLMDAAHSLGQKQAVDEIIKRLNNLSQISAGQLHFTAINPGGLKAVMGSTLRGNAAALWALSLAKPDYPRLADLASWVALRLGQDSNLSTQEAVFGLWGLGSYMKDGDGGPVSMKIALSGRELLSHEFSGPDKPPVTVQVVRNLLSEGKLETVRISAGGAGRPFWSVRLSYAPNHPPTKPVNAGLNLSRVLQPLEGPADQPPAVGQELESVLTLVVTQTRHHVLLIDPFPAGVEPLGAAKGKPQGAQLGGPWRWRELRKDGLLLYAPRLAPGVYSFRYKLRATVPGGFVLRPARAEEMYSPEVHGTTEGGRMVVR
jgi:uncharacterized protein YfaS (alpha-2-macroglobulin family)